MTVAILELLRALLGTPEPVTCISSTFGGASDKHRGGASRYLKRRVEDWDHGIAHRTWKLGTLVAVCNLRNKKCALGRVIDRGPYGAIQDGLWVIKRHERDLGKWRGCVDVAPSTALAIEHDGWERVTVWRFE